MKIGLLDKQTLTDGFVDLEIFKKYGTLSTDVTLQGQELIDFCKDKEVLLINRSIITKEVILAAKNLKYIGVFATGYNNVDIIEAKKHGITVCNVPGYSTEAVVQQTICFILMLANNTEKYSNYVKQGLWSFSGERTYFPYNITRLKGRTLGIFGMGNIGKRLAEIMSVFGMNIIYHSRTKKDLPYKFVDKKTLFKESDFLSFHCPCSNETQEILNKSTISLMKDGAYIINCARGGLIKEQDLADALNSGKIAGAGLDVVAQEPLDKESPLYSAKNIIFTPHIAWADKDTRKELISLVANNLENYINGTPINVVNK